MHHGLLTARLLCSHCSHQLETLLPPGSGAPRGALLLSLTPWQSSQKLSET